MSGRTRSAEDSTELRPDWEREWSDAAAVDLEEARDRRLRVLLGGLVAAAMAVAGLLPALFPLSPGYSMRDTTAQVVAAAVAAAAAVGIVPVASRAARAVSRAVSRESLVVFGVAVLSAGAAAIHFAVAKGHFDEYFLFGLFFVLSGIAQLVWAVLILFRPSPLFLALGAVGNLAIAALWAVDRIWGLPIGPEHWKPEPVGFADVAASAFEVVLVLGCVALLAGAGAVRGAVRERRPFIFALTVVVIALTAMSLLSAVGIGSPLITPSA